MTMHGSVHEALAIVQDKVVGLALMSQFGQGALSHHQTVMGTVVGNKNDGSISYIAITKVLACCHLRSSVHQLGNIDLAIEYGPSQDHGMVLRPIHAQVLVDGTDEATTGDVDLLKVHCDLMVMKYR